MVVDYIIRDVQVYNSYFKKFIQGDVAIKDGKFVYIGKNYENQLFTDEIIDGKGKFMVPGLVDIHMHIESSMTTPSEFSKWAIKHGVTTVVADPHEIANVFGVEGIKEFIKYDEKLDIFYGIPSSVPSTSPNLETTGGIISDEEVDELLCYEKILCLGEVMNFKDLIEDETSLINRIIKSVREKRKNIPLEGHCPRIDGVDLALYIYRGVDGDHTQQSVESIKEKIMNGMFMEIQHKSMSEDNMKFLIDNNLYEHFCLVTDDVMADKLKEGHLNLLLKKAVELGMKLEDAIYVSTFTPARRMGLLDRGTIAPGKIADFLLIEDLEEFEINAVYKSGDLVYESNKSWREEYFNNISTFPSKFSNSVKLDYITEEKLMLRYEEVKFGEDKLVGCKSEGEKLEGLNCKGNKSKVKCRTMEVTRTTTFTKEGEITLQVEDGQVAWQNEDCALIAVFERYGKSGGSAFGIVTGDIIKQGAVATTWAHDHHNLMVMGRNIKDMIEAANKVIEMQGGYAVSGEGEIMASAPLPIGGIVSSVPIEELGEELKKVRKAMKDLGYDHNNEIMSFSTLSLPVSPEIKITDKGLIDVKKQEVVSLYK
ncbi:MAG: adenine deaminase C-terminal domain-containing protein [Clostridium sp.]|uniref:adenine deaminase C-terminal domain-containing protein n=1 Tax=Clostridium sp. TaxID=1506 RepID=UPI0030670851